MHLLRLVMPSLAILALMAILTSCSKGTEVKTAENFELVHLPDGSEIYLNHNTVIHYEEGFDPRQVDLDGEAFFKVSPGDSPFLVSTEHGEIRVLGTEFGVKTDQETLEVEVEEGKVALNTAGLVNELQRGERAIYNKSRQLVEKGKAQFKFRKWKKKLQRELRKMGRELNREGKKLGKEFKKLERDLKKELE